MAELAAPTAVFHIPVRPNTRFENADTRRPVAMNLLMLLWSARIPFTNFPAA
jgi:hypothetical protein